jgi:hypothetical protein
MVRLERTGGQYWIQVPPPIAGSEINVRMDFVILYCKFEVVQMVPSIWIGSLLPDFDFAAASRGILHPSS